MFRDYTVTLWLLKLGALLNLYFLMKTLLPAGDPDAYIVVPAQILFAVSAYRCLFPVRYEHDVVFHDSILSSIFATRLFATFAEIAWIALFAYVLRLFNINHIEWVNVLSWWMVAQVVICQGFVWTGIITERHEFYFFEESGWLLIFIANMTASGYLYLTVGPLGGRGILLVLNVLFGILYGPFEIAHLASLRREARMNHRPIEPDPRPIAVRIVTGLARSIRVKNRSTAPDAWGGFVGLTWMVGYCATLVPIWLYYIVVVLGPR